MSGIDQANSFYDGEQQPPKALLRVNLRNSRSSRTDLARINLLESEPWDLAVRNEFLRALFESQRSQLLALNPLERSNQLGYLSILMGLNPKEISLYFSSDHIPVLLVEREGILTAVEHKDIKNSQIFLTPDLAYLGPGFTSFTASYRRWQGPPFVAEWHELMATPLSQGMWIGSQIVARSHKVATLRFVTGPVEGVPLAQAVWLPIEDRELEEAALLDRAAKEPTQLCIAERSALRKLLGLPKICGFAEPFETAFAHGWEFINISHPATQALIRLLASFRLAIDRRELSPEAIGRVRDQIPNRFEINDTSIPARLLRLSTVARKAGFWHEKEISVEPQDFVRRLPRHLDRNAIEEYVSFGEPLTSWPAKEASEE